MNRDDPSDWEAMDAIEPRAGDDLERVMARYARVRLEPSPAQARRARAAVMESAWRSKLGVESASRRWHFPFAAWSGRRIATAASAAVLAGLLIGSSVFAASRAGGPLYAARISVENAMLPSSPAARLQAELANAQMRLAEASDAAARGDRGALNAALNAYAGEADTLAGTTGQAASEALAAIEQHRAVLVALTGRVPAAALPGLDQALSSSDKAIERLTATESSQNGNANGVSGGPNGNGTPNGTPNGNGNANGVSGGPNGNGTPNGNGNANGNGNGNGNSTTGGGNGNGGPNGNAGPNATPLPAATTAPVHTRKPAPTPNPAHTPGPAASSAAGGAPAASPSVKP